MIPARFLAAALMALTILAFPGIHAAESGDCVGVVLDENGVPVASARIQFESTASWWSPTSTTIRIWVPTPSSRSFQTLLRTPSPTPQKSMYFAGSLVKQQEYRSLLLSTRSLPNESKTQSAKTIEHGCLGNPAILIDLRQKFVTFGMQSHRGMNLFAGHLGNPLATSVIESALQTNEETYSAHSFPAPVLRKLCLLI